MKIFPIFLGILIGFWLPQERVLKAQQPKDYKGWRILFEEVEEKLYEDSLAKGAALMDSLEKIVKKRVDSDSVDEFQLEYLRNLYRWRLGQDKKWTLQRRDYLFSVMGNTHREELLKAKFLFLEAMHQWQEGISYLVIQNTFANAIRRLEKYPDRISQLLLAKILESQSDVAHQYGLDHCAWKPLQRALDIYALYHANNRNFLANLYKKLAFSYEANGLSRQAFQAYQKSIRLFEEEASEINSHQLEAYRGYWHALWMRSDYGALQQSLERFEKRSQGLSLASTIVGSIHFFRAVGLMNQGFFLEGFVYYQEILSLLKGATKGDQMILMDLLLAYTAEWVSYGSINMDPIVFYEIEEALNLFFNREEFALQWEKYYSLVLGYELGANNLQRIEELLDLYQSLLSHLSIHKNLYQARYWTFQAKYHLLQQNFGKAKNLYLRALESWGNPLEQGLGISFTEDRVLLMEIYCSLGEISVKMAAEAGNEVLMKEAEDLIALCRTLLSEFSLYRYTHAEQAANRNFAVRLGELLFEMEELKENANYANLQEYLSIYQGIVRRENSPIFVHSPLYDSVAIYRQRLLRGDLGPDSDTMGEQMSLILDEMDRGGYLNQALRARAVSWEEVGSVLPAQTDLLQYFWGQRKIYILQTQASGFRLYGVRKGMDCDAKALEWTQLLQQNQLPDKISDWAFPLYKQLFFPLKQVSDNVWVIPDGPLMNFPLETLMDGESKEGFFPYLIFRHKFRYLPGIEPLLEKAQSSFFHSSFFGVYNGGQELIKLIGGIFPVSKVVNEKSFGVARFFSYLEEYNVVHLTKGFARKFLDSRKDRSEDLLKESKRADLLVVEDQWVPGRPYGNLMHENRALHFIHSLWEGGILSNKLLFLAFYKRIALGQEIGNSFREAQLDLIEMHSLDKPYGWPYYWAAYRLYGMPGQLPPLRQDPWRSALPAGIIFALLLTIFVFFRYGRKES
jgi:CHAT domain-containing protein